MIETLDILIILLYLCGIFTLAFLSGRKETGKGLVEDQYLAGKSLTFWESLGSIIAPSGNWVFKSKKVKPG